MGKIVKCFLMSFVLLTIIPLYSSVTIAGETIDTDNDGLDDFNEFLKGTNPRVPDSN